MKRKQNENKGFLGKLDRTPFDETFHDLENGEGNHLFECLK
ncbi:MAG: hypothetical protein AB1540_10470 [Bdellovibrionota bacterium]